MLQFSKHFFIGLSISVVIMLGSLALASTHLDTAYIQPRSLVYSAGNFRTYADNKFDGFQQALIGPAAKRLHEKMNNQRGKILDCAYQRASKDLPSSRQTIDNQLKTVFVNAASGNRPIKMTVAYMWSEKDNVGKAPVGNSSQFPEQGDLLRVALNSDYIGAQTTYHLKNDFDYWAGVLAHEVLHNLGYRHPTGYKGSFIEEFGICVQLNGVQPVQLGLTDSDVYDGMQK
ncbi:MAG: hypothetical protein N5P05_004646 (plasmid) [Chroococcopsis gigantea SAG 12.99]|jgi:hypothetical protein|nr:hypothetical protein [Chroococcopsis gigantea SAG 12.99]